MARPNWYPSEEEGGSGDLGPGIERGLVGHREGAQGAQPSILTPKLLADVPGRSEVVQPGADVTNLSSYAQIIDLRGNDEEVTVFNLTLSLLRSAFAYFNILAPSPADGLCLFLVQFGVGGTQADLLVDAFPGCSLALPASFVRVLAFNGGVNPVSFAAMVSSFPGKAGPPTLSNPRTVLALNAIAQSAIPNFARNISVSREISAQGFTASFLNGAFVTIAERAILPGNDLEKWPVPGTARFFQIKNTGAIASNFNTIWELAF